MVRMEMREEIRNGKRACRAESVHNEARVGNPLGRGVIRREIGQRTKAGEGKDFVGFRRRRVRKVFGIEGFHEVLVGGEE